MIRYAPLADSELEDLAARYGLTVIEAQVMERGASNSSYLLRTHQGSFVLTAFSIPLDRVVRIGRLLVLLAEHGLPSKRPVAAAEGGLVAVYRGQAVMLTEYIAGRVCSDLNESMVAQAGQLMAQLHRVPAPGFLADEHAYGHQAFGNVIGMGIDPQYESWLGERRAYLEQQLPAELPRGLIHGDLFWDNLIFEGQRLRAIIDLEEACHYYLIFDLGMAIAGLCRAGPGISLGKARALVAGYERIRELTGGERDSLQLMAEYGAVATSYWRFWRYHVHSPSPDKADMHLEMVRLAEAVADMPAVDFGGAVCPAGVEPG